MNSRIWHSVIAVLMMLMITGCFFGLPGSDGDALASFSISMKQPSAPITSIALIVTGPDMATIANEIPPNFDSFKLDVPAGTARTFTLLINTISVTFKGTTTVDLLPGEETTIVIEPSLFETQIIIPDALNNRIVQIGDMTGTGWKTRNWIDLGFPGDYEFYPQDIDFDPEGRIYIATIGDSNIGVIRLDDIDTTIPDIYNSQFRVVEGITVLAIAIDRVNNYLYYYSNGPNLYRADLLGTVPFTPATSTSYNLQADIETYLGYAIFSLDIKGIAVDENGLVYITDWGTERVYKFDPKGGGDTRIVADHLTTIYEYEPPFDVAVKSQNVYVSVPGGRSEVLQFDKNLKFIQSFGTPNDFNPPMNPGEFYGPKRFVALLKKTFYLIDEDYAYDRIVAFNDMKATNWQIYGMNGSGTGQFKFYDELF